MKLSSATAFFISALLGVCIPTITYLLTIPLSSVTSPETLTSLYQWIDLVMGTLGWAAFVFFIVGIVYRNS